MSTKIFPKGLENFADKGTDWNTDTIRCLLQTAVADTAFQTLTNATNANPVVYTTGSAHGWTNGDTVIVGGVGGNTAANQIGKLVTASGSVFSVNTLVDALAVRGNAAYTSGGYVINLTVASNRQDIDAGQLGTAQQLTTPTLVNGVLDADDVTFTSVSGAQVVGAFIYRDSGAAATDRLLVWHDGRICVTVAADASASATTLWVEPLAGAIPSGTVLAFSEGKTATLSGSAAAGARSLAVNALAASLAAGHTAEGPTTSNGLPVTPNGGNISLTWSASGIAKL
jgi:hypothetical protein